MLGNVWELTRTFFDLHPFVKPAPPTPQPDMTNYCLVAKGGSFGDRWQLLQLSARTGVVGNAWLDLKDENRASSVGLRLVCHSRPGYDLLLHSILRLTYEREAAAWPSWLPHSFAMMRMAGIDHLRIKPSKTPYVHVRGAARAVAFAPVWFEHRSVLGVLRSDVVLRAGHPENERVFHEWKKLPAKKRAALTLPWREITVAPGEWLVVDRAGLLGLADRTGTIRALLRIDRVARHKKTAQRATLRPEPEQDRLRLRFWVEEQPPGDTQRPPGEERSELWALCEVDPNGWPGRRAGEFCREYEVVIPTAAGALRDIAWNRAQRR